MTKIYRFTEEQKNLNDAINRLSVTAYMLTDEKSELGTQMMCDLRVIQNFVNRYLPIEVMEE